MKINDKKYEHLLEKLRQTQPVLNDAAMLTDSIMQQIEQHRSSSQPHFLLWFRAISSSAAIFLLGLFVFQQSEAQNPVDDQVHSPVLVTQVSIDSTCIQYQSTSEPNLLKTYLCYMQQNAIENNQFESSIKQSIQ